MDGINHLIPLLTLIVLETILGIDNVIFISILAGKLPLAQRNRFRYWGLGLAMFLRLGLLTLLAWIMQLTTTLFTLANIDISGKDLILLAGGLFLIYKSTAEIYRYAELGNDAHAPDTTQNSLRNLLIQILILDLVFSLDSIVTAVGMVSALWVMYTAIVVAVGIMLVAAKPISEFITRHPSSRFWPCVFCSLSGCPWWPKGCTLRYPKAISTLP
ncbi:TerC family protein [Spirosoma gilvum]